jgi:hypothetical protein
MRRSRKFVDNRRKNAGVNFKKINKVRATNNMHPKIKAPVFYVWGRCYHSDERLLCRIRYRMEKHFLRRLI